jgi:hypothetical protein
MPDDVHCSMQSGEATELADLAKLRKKIDGVTKVSDFTAVDEQIGQVVAKLKAATRP